MTDNEQLHARMLVLADPTVEEKDGLVWKSILRTGRWELSPGVAGPEARPLIVTDGHTSDPKIAVGLQDIVDNYDAGAVEHVTIPKSHRDEVDENTGLVKKLRIDKAEDGTARLMAGFAFTEPDIAAKVKRGSIVNTSAGLKFNHLGKQDARRFPIVLDHVALTNKPWINGLTPFGVNASQDDSDVLTMQFSEDAHPGDDLVLPDGSRIEVTHELVEELANHVSKLLSSSVEQDTIPNIPSQESTDMTQDTKNKDDAPDPEVKDVPEKVQLSQEDVAPFLKPVTDQNAALLAEVRALRQKDRTRETDDFIGDLKEMGFSEDKGCTDFLKSVRHILLSDDGQATLTLSEEGKDEPVSMSASDLVHHLLDKLPKKDGKLAIGLSQQTTDPLGSASGSKPPATSPDDVDVANLSDEEKRAHYDAIWDRMQLHDGAGF